MTHRNEIPTTHRAHRSPFDQRVLDVTGGLLLGIVWLEHQLASLWEPFGPMFEMAGSSGHPGRLLSPVAVPVTGQKLWNCGWQPGRHG
jgi:hypothetical protein